MLIRSADYVAALPLASLMDLRANQEKTKYGNAEDVTGKVMINHSLDELLILTVTWLQYFNTPFPSKNLKSKALDIENRCCKICADISAI